MLCGIRGSPRDGEFGVSNKKTAHKVAGERILKGEPVLAAMLADALAESSVVDRYTHGFHTYPAGLHPDCVHRILSEVEGGTVLDPFCGGGTVLVEAMAKGKTAIGRDISPVALLVARARTAVPSDEALTRFRSTARAMTEKARHADTDVTEERFLKLADWYAPCALMELDSIRQDIQEVSDMDLRRQLIAAFSSILIKVSWRKSDTSAKREKHRRPPGTAAIMFHKKVRELARKQMTLREVVESGTPKANVAHGDVRSLELDNPVDLIITSPPYPAVYDYVPMQHLRHIWLGVNSEPGKHAELGARRHWREGRRSAQKKWRKDTFAWTKQMAHLMNEGGNLIVVIGDGLTPTGRIDCVGATQEAAHEAGLRLRARASIDRPDYARKDSRWEHIFMFTR